MQNNEKKWKYQALPVSQGKATESDGNTKYIHKNKLFVTQEIGKAWNSLPLDEDSQGNWTNTQDKSINGC